MNFNNKNNIDMIYSDVPMFNENYDLVKLINSINRYLINYFCYTINYKTIHVYF